jgi:acetyltransferase-like isoleucine patch superfamily enzyme
MDTYIHPTAEIEKNVIIGNNTRIWHHCHIRENARIGANCVLGKGVYIDHGVIVGDNCKIQNYVSVYHGVTLENDVFLGPHVTTTNDLYPRTRERFEVEKTLIKRGASIGANATIVCGVTIDEYAMMGAGSVVVEDVVSHGLVMGNPARLVGFVCYCGRKVEVLEVIDKKVKMLCHYCGKDILVERLDYEKIGKIHTHF